MHINFDSHVILDDDTPQVAYHCDLGAGRHSLRIGPFGNRIYFAGSPEQLHDLGVAFLEAARAVPLPGLETDEEPVAQAEASA